MASATSGPPSQARFFDELAARPERVRTGLAVLNVVLWAIPIIILIVFRGWGTSPQYAVIMLFLLGVLSAAVTLIYVAPNQRGAVTEADRLRILVLTETALIGLVAALIGMGLPFTDRLSPIFSAGLDEWRKHPGALLLCGGLLFGGLALMFVGVQLARRFERSHSEMRRLLYGYNAFLAVLFLFAILALINILSYAKMQPFSWFGKTRDWTTSQIYSLTPESEQFLAQLKEPVVVYVMIPGGELRDEITTLLDNFRADTDKISWSFVSRDRDPKTVLDLQRKYFFKEAMGMLVVVGTGSDAVGDFIKLDDLYDNRGMSEDGGREEFKGESALIKSIDYLTSGKAKAKIYFTQGHGELDVKGRGSDDEGVGVLWDRLGQGNYEFHDVDLSKADKIPADAEVVVVAQPRRVFSPRAVAALEEYLDKRNGKLILLSGVRIEGGVMARTGLEGLLLKYSVSLNDDRVLQISDPDPVALDVFTNPTSDNPIARSGRLGRAQALLYTFSNARSVSSTASNAPGGRHSVENLIFANPEQGILVDRDLKASAGARRDEVRNLLKTNFDKAMEMLTQTPVPLAATVSEPRQAARNNPHNFAATDQAPKMVVFGEGTWIANTQINGPRGQNHLQLFSACLSWVRERPDVGIIQVKSAERTRYSVKQGPSDSNWKLFFQPVSLMLLVILGMGGAVWIVRRR